jgi:hypothetical protein
MFLSVFGWDYRKGFEILLRAFHTAHPPLPKEGTQDVILLLKASPREITPGNDVLPLHALAAEILGLEELPANIVFYEGEHDDTQLPRAEYAALHRLADAFVLPTRGEGWCRPCVEAMACGKPMIATNWSAMEDYMGGHNSLPLKYSTEPVPTRFTASRDEMKSLGKFEYMKWALPDEVHLAELLRTTAENTAAQKVRNAKIGAAARATVEKKYTREAVAPTVRKRLDEIAAAVTSGGDTGADLSAEGIAKKIALNDKAYQARVAEHHLNRATAALEEAKTALGKETKSNGDKKAAKEKEKQARMEVLGVLGNALAAVKCREQRAHILQLQCSLAAQQGGDEMTRLAMSACSEVAGLFPDTSARAHTLLALLQLKAATGTDPAQAKKAREKARGYLQKALKIDPGADLLPLPLCAS